ncbi:MAG: tyrosine-type recombinase/integrase [Acidimicrobiia bacterium]
MAARRRRTRTTGTVILNASGTWRARLHTADGSRVSLGSFRTRVEAERALAVAVGAQATGRFVSPRSGKVPFEEYARDWLNHRPGLRPTTFELYEGMLRCHLVPTFGPVLLADITAPMVRRWFTTAQKSGRPAPVTLAKVYRLMRTILNTAVEDDLIVKNPCNIKGAGNEQSPERPIATIEQVEAIADAIDPRYRSLVLLATYCTLRSGELFGLQRRHIDLAARTVTVEQQVKYLADGRLLLGTPKTAAGRRTVSIPANLMSELERHLEQFAGLGEDAWVFRGPTGVVPRSSNWSVYWRKVTASVGIEGLHFHDLRHTGNTLAASTGASTKELMARMGHASTRAALIYQHATRERDDAIASALDAMIAASRTS